MNILQRLEYWGDRHHPRWMDFIRIALGIFLFYKGIDFLMNMSDLVTLMSINTTFNSFLYILIGHLVVFIHILGGIFLMIGFYTRLASIVQIPILLGAIILLGVRAGAMRPYSDILITVIVLLLLIYFAIIGDGPLSMKIGDGRESFKDEKT